MNRRGFFAAVAAGVAALLVRVRSAFAATTNGGLFTVTRQGLEVDNSGGCIVRLLYTSNGKPRFNRTVIIQAGGAIVDQEGNVISSTVPPALATAISTFTSQIDTQISNAAAGGKLDL